MYHFLQAGLGKPLRYSETLVYSENISRDLEGKPVDSVRSTRAVKMASVKVLGWAGLGV